MADAGPALTPVLSAFWDAPECWTLQTYHDNGGYQALRQALTMQPEEVVTMVKDSGLRGRGGAGFPTGLKWSFLPKPDGKPRYLVINADESTAGMVTGYYDVEQFLYTMGGSGQFLQVAR